MEAVLDKAQDELWDIPRDAKQLPWADKRRWTFKTHLWFESDLLVVDLHDLNVKLARKVVKKLIRKAEKWDLGCICFVTGVGNHSEDKATIRPMAIGILQDISDEKGWRLLSGTQGRLSVILDEDRAPLEVTAKLSKTMMFGVYIFLALIIVLFLRGLFIV